MILTAIFGSFILICACLCRVCKSQAGPGQHFGMNSSPNEPFQVDMAPILTGRDSSLPPYLTGTDFNLTNHPSAQNGVCNVFPQLASASPHSGEPPENGAYTVPHRLPSAQSQCDEQPEKGANNSKYSVEDSENRHTYRTPYFSTSKNNVTNPIHTGTDLSELPPPPTYDMVMSADSLYLSSEKQVIKVTNDTCGQHTSLHSYDKLRFHYDGSPFYNLDGSINKCEIKIINALVKTELCVAGYGRLKLPVRWERLCTTRFLFRYHRFSKVMCYKFMYIKECRKADVAFAEFKEPFLYKNSAFEVEVFAEYRAPTATIGNPDDDEANDDGEDSGISTLGVVLAVITMVLSVCVCVCSVRSKSATSASGRNTDVDRMSYEPFQVDVSAIPRSDSPPPYGSLVFDRLDKHGTSEWDPSLPRYICVTDYNTKCPSSQLLDGDLPQDGACYELPQLSSAPPQSGDQYISVPFSVPYQVSESESRQTYGTSRHSTSSDKQATPNPPQPPIELTERPPPPS
ncbi:uncharacterized protein LOC128215944 [Mya arenaria]|uniref:uncharacterized protein LOC128215944 n=1 Tax=Mya arenaria TaxID=6604 RepID=UPI0022E3F5B9|nr:uncharacterized protein LOC128215944 [Mya arenaria]